MKTNSAQKPIRNSGSDVCSDALSTVVAPAAIATKFQKVTRAPPNRSASIPPTGRAKDPSSGPMKVR